MIPSLIKDKQFIFIVSASRSGSTWLQSIINSHPMVAASKYEQTFFDMYLGKIYQRWNFETANIKQGKWTKGLPSLWTEEDFNSFARFFFENVYSHILQSNPKATHILDKNPNYANCVDLIMQVVPDAKIIHLIRDGRNSIVSMLSAKERIGFGPDNAADAAKAWKRYVNNARKASKYGENQYLEIRYEDLKENYTQTLPKLFEFCNLEYKDVLKKLPEVMEKAYSSPNPDVTKDERLKHAIWKSKLTPYQKYIVNQYIGDLLIELGYAKDSSWVFSNNYFKYKLFAQITVKELKHRLKLAKKILLHGKLYENDFKKSDW